MIYACLLHLSNNMWEDAPIPAKPDMENFKKSYPQHYDRILTAISRTPWSEELQCDDSVWENVTRHFAECGGNMLVIDIGDGIQFQSHPEIATRNAWSLERLKNELARLRDLGLEPIPKLNFSTCHDAWMHEYSRMVSSSYYYEFCRDIITEVCALFNSPRLFHIGMDEETFEMQQNPGFMFRCVRNNPLWYHDLNFYCDVVRRCGARPWMWADKLWSTNPEEYSANVPRDVLQSNWYYKEVFDFNESTPDYLKPEKKRLDTYLLLEQLGYEQVPCGSNWARYENFPGTVKYCRSNISQERLKGFLMAPWQATEKISESWLLEACDIVKNTKTGHLS